MSDNPAGNALPDKAVSTQTVYVLMDDAESIAKFGEPKEIDVDRLGKQLQVFSNGIGRALQQCKRLAGDFALDEISLEAKLTAEYGFSLVAKAGVEGTVTLKFARAK
jgi:hypothetical protein